MKSIKWEVKKWEAAKMDNMQRRRSSINDNRVMYGKKDSEGHNAFQLGGEKIDVETACELKEICWGGSNVIPKSDWVKSSLKFQEADQLYAFGLKCEHSGSTKSFQMVIQAYILKHLLFEGKGSKKNANRRSMDYSDKSSRPRNHQGKPISVIQLLRPNDVTQREVLAGAMTEILWKAGNCEQAVISIPDTENSFEIIPKYATDTVTEKLKLFRCTREDELKNTIKKHLTYFTEEACGGLMNLLYSIVLSKGFEELRKDLQEKREDSLISPEDTMILGMSNLVLTGCATPYLHNGIMSGDLDDATNFDSEEGRVGITGRNNIGFLIWTENAEQTESLNLGSRLKTPMLPIWVTCCKKKWGVLFNPNRDLMKSYQAENRFQLFYYSSNTQKEKSEVVLTIDTRCSRGKQKVMIDSGVEDFDEIEEDPLESAIQTKWDGATVDWGGFVPFC